MDDCPIVCRNAPIDITRTAYCEECPRTRKRNEFKRQTERLWEAWNIPASSANFDTTLDTLYQLLNNKDEPKQLPIYYGHLLPIYQSEDDRYDRMNKLKNG